MVGLHGKDLFSSKSVVHVRLSMDERKTDELSNNVYIHLKLAGIDY